MFRLGRLYHTGTGFDLLISLKKMKLIITKEWNYETTCINPRHFFFSIFEKYCTKFQATRSSRSTSFSWVYNQKQEGETLKPSSSKSDTCQGQIPTHLVPTNFRFENRRFQTCVASSPSWLILEIVFSLFCNHGRSHGGPPGGFLRRPRNADFASYWNQRR